MLAALAGVRRRYAGRTVAVVSHVTPIKILIAHALDAPLTSLFRMELSTASVSVVSFVESDPGDGEGEGEGESGGDRGSMRLYNAQAPGAGQMLEQQRW